MSSDDDTASETFQTQYTRGSITTVHAHAFIPWKRKKLFHFTNYCKRLLYKINTSDALMLTGVFNARLDNNKTE